MFYRNIMISTYSIRWDTFQVIEFRKDLNSIFTDILCSAMRTKKFKPKIRCPLYDRTLFDIKISKISMKRFLSKLCFMEVTLTLFEFNQSKIFKNSFVAKIWTITLCEKARFSKMFIQLVINCNLRLLLSDRIS